MGSKECVYSGIPDTEDTQKHKEIGFKMAAVQGLYTADYIVFALMLLVSLGIGIYYSLTGGKQKTTGEYLTGDRKLK